LRKAWTIIQWDPISKKNYKNENSIHSWEEKVTSCFCKCGNMICNLCSWELSPLPLYSFTTRQVASKKTMNVSAVNRACLKRVLGEAPNENLIWKVLFLSWNMQQFVILEKNKPNWNLYAVCPNQLSQPGRQLQSET
jgi:hypothetical protein